MRKNRALIEIGINGHSGMGRSLSGCCALLYIQEFSLDLVNLLKKKNIWIMKIF